MGQIIVGWCGLLLALLFSSAAGATERGALFKVSGHGHTVYLFGTMHVGQADFYPFEPRLAALLAAAPTLALEIDPGLPPEVAARALQKYALAQPAAATPPALAARLSSVLAQAGIDEHSMAPYKPWLIAIALSVGEYTRQGYDTALAVDSQLAALARAQHVKVIELESLDTQLALFDSLPVATQWAFLEQTISEIESGTQGVQARQIALAWASADRAALEAIAARFDTDSTVSGRFMRDVLLDGRNGGLTDAIVALLGREDNSVAAIGVLHLVGPRSVPALMRARGLTVEQVY
ncbi:TraB/GumN family protein [Massilia sp. PWRC2]|uniref:TraB/GumN family protein n=1 Tax=Massilia sp. PWRC2 TaxID=2804626 RepID=UPI003CFB7526